MSELKQILIEANDQKEKCLLLSKNILGSTKSYTELEYIENNGNQCIDTEIMTDHDTKIEKEG